MILLSAAVLLPGTRIGLRFLGYRRVERIVRLVPQARRPADLDQVAARTARVVEAVARRSPIDASCLPQSLVLWGLLRAQGVESALRMGFKREEGEFGAHAWVEHLGLPLNNAGDIGELFEVIDLPPS